MRTRAKPFTIATIHEDTIMPKRVLVTVQGGVADAIGDDGVLIEIVDYDNEPDAQISEDFLYLAESQDALNDYIESVDMPQA